MQPLRLNIAAKWGMYISLYTRKAAAYGDIPLPDLDAEDIAAEIQEYVEAVEAILTAGSDDE